MYDNFIAYFMSGTGNSCKAAEIAADAVRAAGIKAVVKEYHNGDATVEVTGGASTLLALFFPTHAFTAPLPIVGLALRLPPGKGVHAIVVPTRAGMRLAGLYTPGLDGTAGYIIAAILAVKGYNIRGVLGLDMPSNWTVAHPGLSPAAVEGIVSRAKNRLGSFISRISSGKKSFNGVVSFLLGLILLPVSLGYVLMGRFYLAKILYPSSKCNGCGLCARSCPFSAIKMLGIPSRPYWTLLCESCMRCMNYCPCRAIEAGYPFAIALYFITSVPSGYIVLDWLCGRFPALTGIDNDFTRWVISYAATLISIVISYIMFTGLLRFRWFNRLMTICTPTEYYRRYHEPSTSLNDLLK